MGKPFAKVVTGQAQDGSVRLRRMDRQTLEFYDRTAAETAANYRAVDQSAWRRQFQEAFPAGTRVLDVGAGSGRDVALLLSLGFDAYGTEPAAGMRAEAIRAFPDLERRIFPFGLPLPEDADVGGQFDGVVCSAVLMHVPEADLFDAAFSLKRLLREKGKLWISVPGARPGLNAEDRDDAGRLFKPLHPEYLVLLFERLGFQLLRRWWLMPVRGGSFASLGTGSSRQWFCAGRRRRTGCLAGG